MALLSQLNFVNMYATGKPWMWSRDNDLGLETYKCSLGLSVGLRLKLCGLIAGLLLVSHWCGNFAKGRDNLLTF